MIGQEFTRAEQTIIALVGGGYVTASLMPAAVDVLILRVDDPGDLPEFSCRICGARVERDQPGQHETDCVLAVARPGYGIVST